LAVVFFEACAGQTICRLSSPAAALFCGLCLPAVSPLPCHAHCPPQRRCPVQFALPPTCSFHVRQDHRRMQQFASCKNCPVGSNNAGLQWRPARRVASTPPSTVPFAPTRGLHLGSPCAVVCYAVKGGGLGLHVSSRPSSPHLHFVSQRLHASSLAPC